MAPSMGTARDLGWPGGATSTFHSCPVCGQMHTVPVRLSKDCWPKSPQPWGFLTCQASPVLSLQGLDFRLCSLDFCTLQSFGNEFTWGALLTRLGGYRPVFRLHLIGQVHSLCLRLLTRCP